MIIAPATGRKIMVVSQLKSNFNAFHKV
jgi:hypothetical protein